MVSSRVAHKIDLSLAFLFAAGALLTTSIVHIIPEAMEGLAPEFLDDLHGMFLRSGVAILSGIFGAFLLHVALDHAGGGDGHSHSHAVPQLRAAATVAERDCGGPQGGGGRSSSSLDNSAHGSRDERVAAAAGEDDAGFEPGVGASSDRTVCVAYSDALSDKVETGNRISNGRVNGSAASHRPVAECRVKYGGGGGERGDENQTEILAPASSTPGFASVYDLTHAHDGRGVFDLKGLDPVCWNIIVGDLAHNFADGVTMGAAFLGCSSTVGWTVTAASMMHEIPHEIGNFVALVNGGMTVAQVRRTHTPFCFFLEFLYKCQQLRYSYCTWTRGCRFVVARLTLPDTLAFWPLDTPPPPPPGRPSVRHSQGR